MGTKSLFAGWDEFMETTQTNIKLLSESTNTMQSNMLFLREQCEENRMDIKEIKEVNIILKEKLEEINNTSIKALEKVTLRNENDFSSEYMNQADCGLMLEPSLSSHAVGKVLRLIGFAKKTLKTTTPYRTAINNGLAKRGYVSTYSSWFWQGEVFRDKFMDFLKLHGKYEKFLMINDDFEMRNFIDELENLK